MTAPITGRANVTWIFNHLRYGHTYRTVSRYGIAEGEYLGMETPHGDWAVLLRHPAGTDSIPLVDIEEIVAVPADPDPLPLTHRECV